MFLCSCTALTFIKYKRISPSGHRLALKLINPFITDSKTNGNGLPNDKTTLEVKEEKHRMTGTLG